jgi:hypothetical protein
MQTNGTPQATGSLRRFGNPRGVSLAVACAMALVIGVSVGLIIRQRNGGGGHASVAQQGTERATAALQPGTADHGSEQLLVPASTLPSTAAVSKVATIYLVGSRDEAQALQNRLDDLRQFVSPDGATPDDTILVVSTGEEQVEARLAIKQAQLDFGASNVRVDDLRTPTASSDAAVDTPIAPTESNDAPPADSPDGGAVDNPASLTPAAAGAARGGQAEALEDAAPVAAPPSGH